MSLATPQLPAPTPHARKPVPARRDIIALALVALATLPACYQEVVLDPDNLFAPSDTSQDAADDTASDTAPAVFDDDDDGLPDDDDDDDAASSDDDDDDDAAPDDDDTSDDTSGDTSDAGDTAIVIGDDDDSTDSGDTSDTSDDTGNACPETWNLLCAKGIQLTCTIPARYDPPPFNGLLDGLYDWLNTAPDTCFASGTPDWLACEPLFIPPALLPNNAWRDRFPWHGGDCRAGLLPDGTARGDALQCALSDEWNVTTTPPLPTLICQNVSGIF